MITNFTLFLHKFTIKPCQTIIYYYLIINYNHLYLAIIKTKQSEFFKNKYEYEKIIIIHFHCIHNFLKYSILDSE